MRVCLGRAHYVEDGDAANGEGVRDHRTVAAPGDCFGAHDGGGPAVIEREELVDTLGEFRRLHVIRIPAEGRIAPGSVGGVLAGVAEPAEGGEVAVFDTGLSERGGQGIAVELRIVAGFRDCPDVDEELDAVCAEEVQKLREGAVGVADGEQRTGPRP